jgi:hypothetical protein
VLSPGDIAQVHAPAILVNPHTANGPAYGMGWAISSSSEPSIWHSGDTANFHSDVTLLPARELGIVVLMNVNGNLAVESNAQGVIARGVQQLLVGQQSPETSGFQARYMMFDGALLICSACRSTH